MRLNKTTTYLLATAAMAFVALPAAAETWDMPMAYPASNFHTVTAEGFADCVREGTDGDIDITIHANGALFAGADIKRAIQTGQVPIGERLLSGNQNENPIFGVDSIPFLVSSFDEHAGLWDAAQPVMEEVLAEDNLTLLYSVPWPPQGLYFRNPVSSVEDMEGIKFRSYNAATARLAELTGMLPVSIEAAEISQAFSTGVADSMVSSGSTGYDMKVWESLNNFYEVDAWLPRNYIMVNSDVWADVSDENKTAVETCATEAAEAGLAAAKDATDFTLNGLREGGMTVEPASEEMMTGLREVGATMTDEWIAEAGEQGQAIVDAYRASQGN